MKKCVYCTAENRDEAIFCNRCRRPLPTAPRPPRIVFVWLLMAVFLIGFGSYLFSTSSFLAPVSTPGGITTAEPAPTQKRESVTVLACVQDTTRIRRGPGTNYETIGGLRSGTCLRILGRNEEASWVYMVSDDHQAGWVDVSLLKGTGDISRVSVRDHSAMANSSRPTLTSAEIANGAEIYLTQISATNDPQAPLSRYTLPCFDSADRVGDQISCRMEKAYCDYLPDLEGSPTVCNDRPAPDHTFTMIAFERDWSNFDGQCLIVSGYLEINGGALQIQAHNRSQVSTCE